VENGMGDGGGQVADIPKFAKFPSYRGVVVNRGIAALYDQKHERL
jgi:hypothetical protein